MYTGILVFFTVFLKNRNISSKIKRSKVTDYAALNSQIFDIPKHIVCFPSLKLLKNLNLKPLCTQSRISQNSMASFCHSLPDTKLLRSLKDVEVFA